MIFDAYASYYSIFYKEKNYLNEAQFIDKLIRKYKAGAEGVLDVGCGTGNHVAALSKMGYKVTGVDVSEKMLAIARTSYNNDFIFGDLRTVRLHAKFDVITSLFDVISYQVTNVDIGQAFATVYHHLNEGGIFIFDVWHGPGVENDPPVLVRKEYSANGIRIERIAAPTMIPGRNLVHVNLTVIVAPNEMKVEQIEEVHLMRYFFQPEIETFAEQSGFTILKICQWHSEDTGVDEHSWKALYVLKKT